MDWISWVLYLDRHSVVGEVSQTLDMISRWTSSQDCRVATRLLSASSLVSGLRRSRHVPHGPQVLTECKTETSTTIKKVAINILFACISSVWRRCWDVINMWATLESGWSCIACQSGVPHTSGVPLQSGVPDRPLLTCKTDEGPEPSFPRT